MESWFSGGLKKWYAINKRDLPWRNETDPYRIWLSEIILQQTQVAQGLAYYQKFIKNYPAIRDLAKASEDKVLKDWQGLGYYSRARNLHAAAKFMVAQHGGQFPSTYKEIRALKGVGDYTAAAISSFVFNAPYAVVDGNVYRLLSRVFGIDVPIDGTQGKKDFQELATSLLDKKDPATHNQAIMEFGSQYCKPLNPNCNECIFKDRCAAFKTNKVNVLPVKEKKTKITTRYFNYVVAFDKDKKLLVNKRPEGDIWQGLYEFPLIESEKDLKAASLLKHPYFRKLSGKRFSIHHQSKTYKHILSHQHLYAKFYVIKTSQNFKKNKAAVNLKTLGKIAFPRLIEKFMSDCILNEIC
jgi:A/G-specific adenine glycosylase